MSGCVASPMQAVCRLRMRGDEQISSALRNADSDDVTDDTLVTSGRGVGRYSRYTSGAKHVLSSKIVEGRVKHMCIEQKGSEGGWNVSFGGNEV